MRPGRWGRRPVLAALALLLPMLAAPAAASAGELDRFFGSYVGRAEEGGGGPGELRDVDLVIAPEGRGGLVVRWTNVTLVDGRRDVPGVRRRTDEVRLTPAGQEGRPGLYLARASYDPFTERERPDPLAGHPVRWATVEGDALRTYSLVVLDDGRYELQVYARTLTPEGVALDWRRIVDGETVRRMTGRTVRAD